MYVGAHSLLWVGAPAQDRGRLPNCARLTFEDIYFASKCKMRCNALSLALSPSEKHNLVLCLAFNKLCHSKMVKFGNALKLIIFFPNFAYFPLTLATLESIFSATFIKYLYHPIFPSVMKFSGDISRCL